MAALEGGLVLKYLVSSDFSIYCWLLTVVGVITAWIWQGSYESGYTFTKARKDLRYVFFQMNKIMKFGVLLLNESDLGHGF